MEKASYYIPAEIDTLVQRCALVGSRVTCEPPVMDTDRDILALVLDFGSCAEALHKQGWNLGGSGESDDQFESWTLGELNLILTDDEDFYDRFIAATTVCARLNLLDKEDRKSVFRAVLYSENADGVNGTVAARSGWIPGLVGEPPF